ncbi:MAG: DUF4335 domain-containing protein [Leptolyngbya sp. SIO4C1]|nr:DUF4335 domain-containing protein [Leptolyngbya sp. SIO4C1]
MTPVPQLLTQAYSANSCRLEVTAVASPLSRWHERPILKQARFRLWLQAAEASPTLIAQGNQRQLQQLIATVQHYVQSRLATSQPALLGPHRLPASSIRPLTTFELFDLAETLDQYEQAAETLPALAPPRRKSYWLTGSAAAAILLTVGITATLRSTYQPAAEQVETAQVETAAEAPRTEPSGSESIAEEATNAPADAARPSPAQPPAPAVAEPTAEPEAAPAAPAADAIAQSAPADSPPQADRPAAAKAPAAPVPENSAPENAVSEDAVSEDAAIASEDRDLASASRAARSEPSPAAASIEAPESQTPESSTEAAGLAAGNAAEPSAPTVLTAVRQYLASRLSDPPAAERRYELQLRSNGTLSEILPLNDAAAQHPLALPAGPIAPASAQPLRLQATITSNGQIELIELPAEPPPAN